MQLEPLHGRPSDRLLHWPLQHGRLGSHTFPPPTQPPMTAQTPLVHASSALQHWAVDVQLSLVLAQAAAAWQVPWVAPAGMEQDNPTQQSAFTVQLPADGMQEVCVPGVPA